MNRRGKTALLVILAIALVYGLSAGGCISGVSQAEYQKVSTELATVKTDYDNMQANYNKMQSQFTRLNQYELVLEMCIEAWNVLVGEPSKFGYTKADTKKWMVDMDTKVKAVDDTVLTSMWKAYMTAPALSAEQTKRGVQMMSYLMDRIKALSANK